MRAALDPNGADAYWAGRFGLIPPLIYGAPPSFLCPFILSVSRAAS